jgi:hypothetical protein
MSPEFHLPDGPVCPEQLALVLSLTNTPKRLALAPQDLVTNGNSYQLRRSAMTRIAYLTTDELNEAEAAQLADECRVEIHPLLLRDPPPNGEFDAVLYDLDYLPVERRQVVLAELLAGPPHSRVGVHSFNLDEEQEEALRRNHVVVARRLDEALIRQLLSRS